MVAVSSLDRVASHALVRAFADAPASSISDLKRRLGESLDDQHSAMARSLVDEALGIMAAWGTRSFSSDVIAASVAQSDALTLTEHERLGLQETLAGVLESQALRTLGKANELAQEQERVMRRVRVLTDIRPVFADPDDRPLGAVVSQRLRISFWHAGLPDDLEVALTPRQVDELVTELRRAQAKAESINSMLDAIPLGTFHTELIGDQ